jgi:ribonuclease BN (tRNA processing enzyme)
MKLKLLGIGSGLDAELGNTNALLTFKGTKNHVLLDCGFSTPAKLKRMELMDRITDIFITHLHGDHIYGLEMFGFASFFLFKRRPNLIVPSRHIAHKLWEHCLKGSMEEIQASNGAPIKATLETYYNVIETKERNLWDGWKAYFNPTDHVPKKESYSIVFRKNESQKSRSEVIWTSDTRTPVYSKEASHIFHDCQLYETEADVHCSVKKLLYLPEEIRKKIIAVHFGDPSRCQIIYSKLNDGRIAARFDNGSDSEKGESELIVPVGELLTFGGVDQEFDFDKGEL